MGNMGRLLIRKGAGKVTDTATGTRLLIGDQDVIHPSAPSYTTLRMNIAVETTSPKALINMRKPKLNLA